MKTFKTIDFWISSGVIVFFTVLCLFDLKLIGSLPRWTLVDSNSNLITGYFVVGAWQVLSMLVHALAGWFTTKGSARVRYTVLVLIVIMLVSLCLLGDSFLVIFLLYPLLFLAPVMAVSYTVICYRELFIKMRQRPLDILK